MINKVFDTFEEAVKDVPDGAVILIGNFAGPGGTPFYLIQALRRQGAKNLTIVANTAGGIGLTLDYDDPDLRRYMSEAMKWWVAEVGFDGFRCDVAGFVPLDFWDTVRRELDAIRPVFMLAEWEQRDLHARAFDATYTWGFYDTLHDIAQGRADVGALTGYYLSLIHI